MAQQGNRVGQRLGNYQFERLLGRGGFAEVYLGSHVRLHRLVAIKVLHTTLTQKEIEEFEREARTIAALSHPNIVQVFDFDVQEGVPFLVMDYLPNGTLRQRHNKGERVPLPTVIFYVKQVAAALQYAHERRLIHRDIKPENMLIGRRGEIVLSDFGIAAIAQSSSSMAPQSAAGTIHYMAPEQIQSYARPASDQYALGVVTYEWLSGERPFEGSYNEIFGKQLMASPAPLREKVPGLPQAVEPVVFRALAKEPGQRFRSVQAFATALTAAGEARQRPEEPGRGISEKANIVQYSPQPLLPSGPVRVPHTKPLSTNLAIPVAREAAPELAAPLSAPIAPPQQARGKLSRRTVLIGLASLGALAVGGGIAWVVLAHHPLFVYRGHAGSVSAVSWSPDGKRIASGSWDKTIQVWNASDGRDVFTYRGHADRVTSVAWSPDATRIASGYNDYTVEVWYANNGNNAFVNNVTIPHGKDSVAWSPDGIRIASDGFGYVVEIWNATDGTSVFTYKGHAGPVTSVAWSPDGKRIASGSWDSTVQVWNASDGSKVFTYKGHTTQVNSVAWSPDGKRIASGSYDRTVQVWDAADGRNSFTYKGHPTTVYSVAWSPDGTRIASAGGDPSGASDFSVQVWNAADGHNILKYQGHSDIVTSLAWSPDGTRIASSSWDTTVQIWKPS